MKTYRVVYLITGKNSLDIKAKTVKDAFKRVMKKHCITKRSIVMGFPLPDKKKVKK